MSQQDLVEDQDREVRSLSPEQRRKDARHLRDRLEDQVGPGTRAWEVAKRTLVGTYNDGFIHAGNLAYLSMLAIFPFFILGAAVFSAFGEEAERAATINAVLSAMPPVVGNVIEPVARDAIEARSGWLLWVGGLVGLWTVGSLIETIRDILRRAYGTHAEHAFWKYRLLSSGVILGAVLLLVHLGTRRRVDRADRWVAGVLALWLLGRAGVETLAFMAHDGARRASFVDVESLENLTGLSATVGATTTAIFVVALVAGGLWAVGGWTVESPALGLWGCAALLGSVLLLGTSAALEPHIIGSSVQTHYDDIWELTTPEVEPLTLHDLPGEVVAMYRNPAHVWATLGATGELTVFSDRWIRRLAAEEVMAPPESDAPVHVIVDRRATLGDVRRAAHQLRYHSALTVHWRSNGLDRAAHASNRWAAVEMAGRALRHRRIELLDRSECPTPEAPGDAPATCVAYDQYRKLRAFDIVGEPDATPIGQWLREHRLDRDLALMAGTAFPDDPREGGEAFPDRRAWLPDDLWLRWRPSDLVAASATSFWSRWTPCAATTSEPSSSSAA